MKLLYSLIVIITLAIFGCGPSKQEIEKREKEIKDSIALVEYQKEVERVHLEKIEVGKSVKRMNLESLIEDLEAQLIKQKEKLNEINQFQIGRSRATKDSQLYEQRVKITELESMIDGIKFEITQTHLFNSFDFQDTPEGTVNYIFEVARTGEFDNMRFLIDPYGEFQPSVLYVCLPGILSPDNREKWSNQLRKGRIMSSEQIADDKVEIEIAVGYNSDELEKIRLVKRMDRWYILDIVM